LNVQEALVKKSQEEKKRKNDLERKRGEAAADWRPLPLITTSDRILSVELP
jgi:hypothetical protein